MTTNIAWICILNNFGCYNFRLCSKMDLCSQVWVQLGVHTVWLWSLKSWLIEFSWIVQGAIITLFFTWGSSVVYKAVTPTLAIQQTGLLGTVKSNLKEACLLQVYENCRVSAVYWLRPFFLQEHSWEDHGYPFLNSLYPDLGPLLDDKFKLALQMTYRRYVVCGTFGM